LCYIELKSVYYIEMHKLCIPFHYSISVTHTYNDIYETELRPSYRSPFCISVIKSEYIYQVRWHLWNSWLVSSQM